MGRRESFLLRGMPLGLIAMGLAVVVDRTGALAAPGLGTAAPLILLLVALGALLLRSLIAAGPWALADLALPGILFAAAGGTLLDTPYRGVALAYLGVGAVGVTALLVGMLVAGLQDRRARDREALLEARREMGRIHRRLWLGTQEVSDHQIRAAVAELRDRVDGDDHRRAAALFGAIAPLCHARPHMTEELLAAPLSFLEAAGVADGGAVVRWVADRAAAGSGLETDERGRRWLAEELPGMEARIDRLLGSRD